MSGGIRTSFRDPAGRLIRSGGRVFRIVNATGLQDLNAFFASATCGALVKRGDVVGTRMLNLAEQQQVLRDLDARVEFDAIAGQTMVEHERIGFPSFPYEWAPEMLCTAGLLTLDLAGALLPENLGLKDATPYNILFRGPAPVFIDVLSFERRRPGDSVWLPYAQFVRTFLLPLLANRYYGLPVDASLFSRRDGLEPEEVYRWANALQKLRPPFLNLVTLPTWAGRRHNRNDAAMYQKRTTGEPEKARFILKVLLKGLRRTLENLSPSAGRKSVWSDYMTTTNTYSAEHLAAKKKFVEEVLSEFHPKRVLDVGCNTGFFSEIAARAGAGVVAIDYDPVVVGETWRMARGQSLDILPLVVNLTRPTPGMGWRNSECPSFLDRSRSWFDAVLMLAVVHHMLVTERIPLEEIVDLAAELTNELLIFEFISPEDSMFLRLMRGREELHRGLDFRVFENACMRRFEIVRTQHLDGTWRWLYALRKRA